MRPLQNFVLSPSVFTLKIIRGEDARMLLFRWNAFPARRTLFTSLYAPRRYFACSQNSSRCSARSQTPCKIFIIVCHVSQNFCTPFASPRRSSSLAFALLCVCVRLFRILKRTFFFRCLNFAPFAFCEVKKSGDRINE